MNPLQEWEIIDVTTFACSNDSNWNKKWPLLRLLIRTVHAFVSIPGASPDAAKQGQAFHGPAAVAIGPSWKPNCRYIEVCVPNSLPRLAVIDWQPKSADT